MKVGQLSLSFLGFVILFFMGCNQVVAPNTQNDVTRLPTETQQASVPPQGEITQMAPIISTPSTPSLQNLIEKAKEDLAQRLSIPVSQINLVEAMEVTWSDSSLGCPQPGMAYADVLTPGYLILLNTNNQEYEYHASKGTQIVYCENPTPPIPGFLEDK